MNEHRTARYRKISEGGGIRYLFFCDLSGALVCTSDIQMKDDLMNAWNGSGKQLFNHCHQCGRWVSDPMYNAETLNCVCCSPWEEQPAFCPQCGEKVAGEDAFCHKCHARLKYREKEECG